MASLPLVDVKVQGLSNFDAHVQGATQSAIAGLNASRFIPNLIASKYLIGLGLASFTSASGGTDNLTLFDNEVFQKPGVRTDVGDAYKDDKQGDTLKGIEILTSTDTEYEVSISVDRNNLLFENRTKLQQMIGEAYRNTLENMGDSLMGDMLNMLTGKVATSKDGRPIASELTATLNTTLGQATSDEDRIQNFLKLREVINENSNTFTKTSRFKNPADYRALVSRRVMQEFSVALERYNGVGINNIVSGEVQGMKVNGIHIIECPYLENEMTPKKNSVNSIKQYDFKDIPVVWLHKDSYFLKLWTLLRAGVDIKKLHMFHTLVAAWSVDGFYRPALAGYFTKNATPSIAV